MKSVLIFRIGSLGDTLVALPAMWLARQHFANDRLTLLCDRQFGQRYVLAADLLKGSGVVDDFLLYPVDRSLLGQLLRPLRMLALLITLRWRKFDALVYLVPSLRSSEQIKRDRWFFRAAGIREFIGMEGFTPLPQRIPGQPLPAAVAESELLVDRLKASGLSAPAGRAMRADLGITADDDRAVEQWLAGLPSDGRRRWIAIGPGSKMPAKIWPAERYRQVVQRLIEAYDVWPVIFGGAEDREVGRELLQAWGRGYNAAGALGLRPSAAALRRCALYLGNDTGTMHMAAAGGVRCVALFSARGHPGQWYPYGPGHRVFRVNIDCEGCGLVQCIERRKECLMRIMPDEVYDACAAMLAEDATPDPVAIPATAKGSG